MAHPCSVQPPGECDQATPPNREDQTMTTSTDPTIYVTAGADTHRDTHMIAALDQRGAQLGVREFATDPTGHDDILNWLESFGAIDRIGVEGTGTYGAGLCRFLNATTSTSSRSPAVTVKNDEATASPTRSMPLRPHVLRSPAKLLRDRSRAPAVWKQSGRCAW